MLMLVLPPVPMQMLMLTLIPMPMLTPMPTLILMAVPAVSMPITDADAGARAGADSLSHSFVAATVASPGMNAPLTAQCMVVSTCIFRSITDLSRRGSSLSRENVYIAH